jgi:hypothetical protein
MTSHRDHSRHRLVSPLNQEPDNFEAINADSATQETMPPGGESRNIMLLENKNAVIYGAAGAVGAAIARAFAHEGASS